MKVVQAVPMLGTSLEDAADGIIYLTTSSESEETTGSYFDRTQPTDPDSRVEDDEYRELIWSVSADLCDVDPDWP